MGMVRQNCPKRKNKGKQRCQLERLNNRGGKGPGGGGEQMPQGGPKPRQTIPKTITTRLRATHKKGLRQRWGGPAAGRGVWERVASLGGGGNNGGVKTKKGNRGKYPAKRRGSNWTLTGREKDGEVKGAKKKGGRGGGGEVWG